jgi:hypothetical protein
MHVSAQRHGFGEGRLPIPSVLIKNKVSFEETYLCLLLYQLLMVLSIFCLVSVQKQSSSSSRDWGMIAWCDHAELC